MNDELLESAKANLKIDVGKLIQKFKEIKKFNKYDADNIDAAIDVLENFLPPQCPSAFRNFIKILTEKYDFDKDDFEDNFYKMSSETLGYCLIINNMEFDDPRRFEFRHGSEVDEKNLREFFEKAGFKVKTEHNLTSDEMRECITKFSNADFSKVDSMILVIMSHGGQQDNIEVLYGKDGGYLSRYFIYKQFSNRKESLQQKPKVFFFIACRGDYKDYGVLKSRKESFDGKECIVLKGEKENGDGKECGVLNDGKESEDEMECDVIENRKESVDDDNIQNTCNSIAKEETLTELSDIFVINSTLPYNLTVRHHEKGTYFCQFLIPVLNKHHRNEDLEAMIKRVNRQMVKILTAEYRLTQAVHYESNVCLKYLWLCRKS